MLSHNHNCLNNLKICDMDLGGARVVIGKQKSTRSNYTADSAKPITGALGHHIFTSSGHEAGVMTGGEGSSCELPALCRGLD